MRHITHFNRFRRSTQRGIKWDLEEEGVDALDGLVICGRGGGRGLASCVHKLNMVGKTIIRSADASSQLRSFFHTQPTFIAKNRTNLSIAYFSIEVKHSQSKSQNPLQNKGFAALGLCIFIKRKAPHERGCEVIENYAVISGAPLSPRSELLQFCGRGQNRTRQVRRPRTRSIVPDVPAPREGF